MDGVELFGDRVLSGQGFIFEFGHQAFAALHRANDEILLLAVGNLAQEPPELKLAAQHLVQGAVKLDGTGKLRIIDERFSIFRAQADAPRLGQIVQSRAIVCPAVRFEEIVDVLVPLGMALLRGEGELRRVDVEEARNEVLVVKEGDRFAAAHEILIDGILSFLGEKFQRGAAHGRHSLARRLGAVDFDRVDDEKEIEISEGVIGVARFHGADVEGNADDVEVAGKVAVDYGRWSSRSAHAGLPGQRHLGTFQESDPAF